MTFDAHAATDDARHDENGTATEQSAPPNHNFLMSAAASIRERFADAKGASKSTLEASRVIGETLNEVKDTLAGTGKGAFGKWCDECRFPFDPSWRARLMKLAANWPAIMEAVEALPEDKQKWSVDGVMAAWAAAKKAAAGTSGEGGGEGKGEGSGEEKPAKAKKETEAEKLRRLLAEALAENERLKAELAKAGKGKPFEERDFGKHQDKAKPTDDGPVPGFVSGSMKVRAAKVWALFQRGGTEGEKNAAKSRLEDMAAKVNMTLTDFVKACNLK